MYTVAQLLDGWAPEIGQRVSGDLSTPGRSDLVCTNGTNTRVHVHRCGCNIEVVREMPGGLKSEVQHLTLCKVLRWKNNEQRTSNSGLRSEW
jgi:hypothetical protein